MNVKVKKIKLDFPGDCTDLERVISKENIEFPSIKAILTKTNGNGAPNDYSRQLAEINFVNYFKKKYSKTPKEINKKIILIHSSGCEGLITPHGYIFYTLSLLDPENNTRRVEKGLVIGTAESSELEDSKIGTLDHVRIVSDTTRQAITQAGISDLSDVALVFVKSPIRKTVLEDLKVIAGSIPTTRSASALGVGLALGEIDEASIVPGEIGLSFDAFSKKAFTFSGNELQNCRVIVLGNAPHGSSDHFIRSNIVQDLLDTPSIDSLLQLIHDGNKLVAFFAKVSIHPSGVLRGKKVALINSDLAHNRETRAAASGVFSALLQDTEIFISAGAENQGPIGGGVIAAIFKKERGKDG